MVKLLPLSVTIFFLQLFMDGAEAQPCNCPVPQVLVYHFNPYKITPAWLTGEEVKAPKYTNLQQYQYFTWTESPHLGAEGFFYTAAQENPGIHFSKADGMGPLTWDSLPLFIDYFVDGEYDTSKNGGYLLQVKIVEAHTKKEVTTTTVYFQTLDSTREAGAAAALQLSPLLQKLLNYEHQVRDIQRKDQSAVAARYEITAAKTQLNTKDTTMIRIRLFDCDDGAPLKNRKLSLKLSGSASTISPAFITTDINGNATAIFKAGQKSETVTVYPVYQYVSVANKKSYALACVNDLKIDILPGELTDRSRQAPAGKVKWHITVTYQQKNSLLNNSKTGESHEEFNKSGTIDMYVLTETPEKGHVLINTESDQLLSGAAKGEVTDKSESKKTYLDGHEYRKDEYFGEAEKTRVGIFFEYDPEGGTGSVLTGIYFNKKGHYEIKRTASDDSRSWDTPVEEDYGAYSATIGKSDDKIQKLNNGFTIDGGSMVNKEEDDLLHGHSSEKGFVQYHITIVRE